MNRALEILIHAEAYLDKRLWTGHPYSCTCRRCDWSISSPDVQALIILGRAEREVSAVELREEDNQ